MLTCHIKSTIITNVVNVQHVVKIGDYICGVNAIISTSVKPHQIFISVNIQIIIEKSFGNLLYNKHESLSPANWHIICGSDEIAVRTKPIHSQQG